MSDTLERCLAALIHLAVIAIFIIAALRSPELDPRDEAGMDDDQREALRIIHNGEDH